MFLSLTLCNTSSFLYDQPKGSLSFSGTSSIHSLLHTPYIIDDDDNDDDDDDDNNNNNNNNNNIY